MADKRAVSRPKTFNILDNLPVASETLHIKELDTG